MAKKNATSTKHSRKTRTIKTRTSKVKSRTKTSTKKLVSKKQTSKKSRNKKNKAKTIILTLLVISILIASTALLYDYTHNFVLGVVKIPYRFRVSDHLGLAASNTTLDFGIILPTSSAFKNIVLHVNKKSLVSLKFKGEGSQYFWYEFHVGNVKLGKDNPSLIMLPNQNFTITVHVSTVNASMGNYSGFAEVWFYNPDTLFFKFLKLVKR